MRRPRVLILAGWLIASQLLPGCATAQPAQLPAAPSAGPPAQTPGNDYIIGPGDTLEVFVWRNPELSVTIPVRPDGKISTPLVENMGAVGKTASQLARDMEGVLAKYVRSPEVNIIVKTAMSAYSQVKVVGQVVHPQALPYREGMTVLDAILAVGGLGQFAAGNRSRIVRVENGQETVIKLKLSDLVNSGDVRQNVALKPGDVVVVPQSMF
jgi:polysaccharide export outer membrane protein